MIRRSFLILAGVLLLSSAWASGNVEPAKKVTLVHMQWSEKTQEILVPDLAKRFMAANPNIEIKLLFYAHPESINKIRFTLSSGADLDTFKLGNSDSPWFLANGLAKEVMPQAFDKKTVKEVVDLWEPGAFGVTGGQWNGKYYGIPDELSNYVAWMNKKQMVEAGLDPKADLPKDWDQFAAVGKKLTVDTAGSRTRNGFAINPKTGLFYQFVYTALVEQMGLSWATEDDFLKSLDDPKILTALTTISDFATKYKIWDPGLFSDEREGFGNGLTSTFLTGGTWYWGVLEAYSVPKDDVVPFPYPRFKGGKDIGGPGYGSAMFVSNSSKHPLEAWKWVNFQDSYPNEWMTIGKQYQPKKTLDPKLANQYIPNSDVFVAEFKKTATLLASTHFDEISDALMAFTSRIIFENKSAEESLVTLKQDVHKIFGK